MERYNNRGGNSGIRAYKELEDGILVEFSSGFIYGYTNSSAGVENILTMKQLAKKGEGLNSFINKYVRNKYVFKYPYKSHPPNQAFRYAKEIEDYFYLLGR